ncbi:MAG: family 78 glycoside hydrolase catalytic domain [Fimbriimonadaceae bacterium]
MEVKLVTLLFGVAMLGIAPAKEMKATELRCEFRSNPLGVDSPIPRLSWILEADGKDQVQSAYRVLVASSKAHLDRQEGDLWDSGKVVTRAQNNIEYRGKRLAAGKECFWIVQVWDGHGTSSWSKPATWEMADFGRGAVWINDGKSNPTQLEDFYKEDPAPLLRKEFAVRGNILRARLTITGLGYYEASLNGKKVGDHVLDPGWTKPDSRVLYSTFDVTKSLRTGANCLGVMLGNGWYNPLPMKMWGNLNLRDHLAIGRPRVLAQLHIEFADGSHQTVVSDQSWKTSEGPILRNSVYLGELYDARKEQPGWNKPGFDDSRWRKPGVAPEPVGQLQAQIQPPIRVTETWHPVSVNEVKPNIFIYDCGKNFAGLLKINVNLPKGTRVEIRYGELLYKDGTLNARTSVAGQIASPGMAGPGAPDTAWQLDTFIAKGGPESYTPTFTFHGFRYVEIKGLPKSLALKDITCLRMNSDVEEVGFFECSNNEFNRIYEICRNTFLSNIFGVQSDCPAREKMGYGGDIVATSEAFILKFDMANFYTKTVRDFGDSARPNGLFTDTAPFMGINYCGVGWAMAHPVLISQLLQYYGNEAILAEQYEAAKKWLLQVQRDTPDNIIKDGLSDHESLTEAPPSAMITPLYFKSARILAAMADRLGKTEDAAHFVKLALDISNAYQAKFIESATGRVGPGTQASQAFGIWSNLDTPNTLQFLLKDLRAHGGHLTTGIMGTKFMLDALSRSGEAEIAYEIVNQPDFPGWRWMLKNGATTLWEHWEKEERIYSHNHPMFGSVSQWMMNWLGGIQPADDAIGFDKIVIRPQTLKDLDWVKSSYKSVRGRIVSNWKRVGKKTFYDVEVPVNTSAEIHLPSGVEVVGSGKYHFETTSSD